MEVLLLLAETDVHPIYVDKFFIGHILMSSVRKGENMEYIFIDFTLHIHVPVADVNNPTHEDSIIIY